MRPVLPALACFALLLAGCNAPAEEPTTTPPPPPPPPAEAMNFTVFQMPAIHQGHGLYEPTIDVSPEGTIYVSSHSTGVGAGPAPGYFSRDDGATWQTLALAGPAATPAGQQGSAPLFSDEIFIVAGADGTAWGVDINLRDYIVTGWCNNGAELCYYNPNAYDHAQSAAQATECNTIPAKDRPWAAYANGTLLMINNNAGVQVGPVGGPAPVQIGVLAVPPAIPAEAGPLASGIQWNMCASSGGFIPGIPDIRNDGFFAAPQVQDGKIVVVTGFATDVMAVQQHDVMKHGNSDAPGSEIGDYGQASFDATGALFVAGMNNSGDGGEFQIAVSVDGSNFTVAEFPFDLPVSSLYIDGNRNGPGALANWGLVDEAGTDWYFGHLFFEGGRLVLKNVYKAVDDGPAASRHVQGAAVGPDGRAYMVMSEVSGNDDEEMAMAIGTMPLSVVVQTAGVRMPVTVVAPADAQ